MLVRGLPASAFQSRAAAGAESGRAHGALLAAAGALTSAPPTAPTSSWWIGTWRGSCLRKAACCPRSPARGAQPLAGSQVRLPAVPEECPLPAGGACPWDDGVAACRVLSLVRSCGLRLHGPAALARASLKRQVLWPWEQAQAVFSLGCPLPMGHTSPGQAVSSWRGTRTWGRLMVLAVKNGGVPAEPPAPCSSTGTC